MSNLEGGFQCLFAALFRLSASPRRRRKRCPQRPWQTVPARAKLASLTTSIHSPNSPPRDEWQAVISSGLTEAEMAKLLATLKRNRQGHGDWLIGLMLYRHGLRVSEACDLR